MASVDLTPAELNYTIWRGDDFSDTVIIKEGTPAVAVNVTGRTYTAQLRSTITDPIAITMAIDMTNAITGIVGYSLTDTQTTAMNGSYGWDFQQVVSGVTRTLMTGTFTVKADWTHA